MIRKICYVSGTRADFGLMKNCLREIAGNQDLELDLLVTGTHLSLQHGYTVQEIHEENFIIRSEFPVALEPSTGHTMAKNIGRMLDQFVDALAVNKPDIVLLLGDRGEMLAGALAAIHLNIPTVHIHGGELSGTIDEPIRHAISKLAHYHFTATETAKNRLIRMGEKSDCIYVTGAPGLDGLTDLASIKKSVLCHEIGFNIHRPIALMLFHPVLQEADVAGESAQIILDGLLQERIQILTLTPNSDAGSDAVRSVLSHYQKYNDVVVFNHLVRTHFVSWMKHCDFMIGNSSAGIIEAGSFGTPVINLGIRQNLRERNNNVYDIPIDGQMIKDTIRTCLANEKKAASNIYGKGNASKNIVKLLTSIRLTSDLLDKVNAY